MYGWIFKFHNINKPAKLAISCDVIGLQYFVNFERIKFWLGQDISDMDRNKNAQKKNSLSGIYPPT